MIYLKEFYWPEARHLSYNVHVDHSLLFWYTYSDNQIYCLDNQKVRSGCPRAKHKKKILHNLLCI